MKLALALVLVGAALAALPATAGAAPVIRSAARLADYRVKADGTLLGARRAFGARAPRRGAPSACGSASTTSAA